MVSTLALALAALLIVVLASQKRSLEHELRRLRGEVHLPQVGDAVPPLQGVTLAGDSVVVAGYEAQVDQVLLVLSSSCAFCVRAVPEWNRLADGLRDGQGVSVYGLALDADSVMREFVRAHALAFPVLRFPDERAAATYRAFATPLTLVIDRAGFVRFARAGVLVPAVVDSLVAVLGSQSLAGKGATEGG